VVVSVVGLAHRPGLVTLTAGDRIADAVEGAGGALDGADLVGLNMARRVTDGEQIIVGLAGPPGSPTPMGSSVIRRPRPHARRGSPMRVRRRPLGEPEHRHRCGTGGSLPGWSGDRRGDQSPAGRQRPFASVELLGEVDWHRPGPADKLRDRVVT
jgi:competence protein ComEA